MLKIRTLTSSLLLAFTATSSAFAATCTVTEGTHFTTVAQLATLLGNGGAGGSGECPQTTAGNELIVQFVNNTFLWDSVAAANYSNAANLTLLGAGPGAASTIVNGSGNGAGFFQATNSGTTVTLRNLTFTNKLGGSNFGAMYIYGNFVMANAAITGITAPQRGTRVTGNVSLTNSEISGNSAQFGAGLWLGGNGTTLAVTDSVIKNNSTSAVNGAGGIYALGTFGAVTITRSEIAGNSASGGPGGGMLLDSDTSPLVVVDSTISGNSSNQSGAGIWQRGGDATITNSTVSGNSAGLGGGGINLNGSGTLRVNFSTFANNFSGGSPNSASMSAPNVIANGAIVTTTNDASPSVLVSGAKTFNYSVSNNVGNFSVLGTNLVSTNADINLGGLSNNGGTTQTMLPGAGSSAIGFVPASIGTGLTPPVTTDQRGNPRSDPYSAGAVQVSSNTAPTANSVAISGIAQVGLMLSGSYIYADAESDSEGASTFRWVSNTVNTGVAGGGIVGTTQDYTPDAGDQGKYLYFCVIPVADSGSSPGTEVCSNATAAVQISLNSAPTVNNVAISGIAQVGVMLSGSYIYADAESDSEGASTFRWVSNTANTGVAGGSILTTIQNYTPGAGDQGKYLYFCVTPVASSGSSPGTEVCSSATAAVLTDDGDGVSPVIEDNVPSAGGSGTGDGNGDGTADSLQPHVTSLPTVSGEGYATIVSLNNRPLVSVSAVAKPGDVPAAVGAPFGAFSFTATGVLGTSEPFELYIPFNPAINAALKRNRNTGVWENVSTGIMHIGTIKTKITFSLTDGGPYDADGAINGQIQDPILPAIWPAVSGIPTLSEWGMIVLSGLLTLGTALILRRQRR